MSDELLNNVPSTPSMDDFIPEGSEESNIPDPSTVIKFVTSGGEEAYVPVAGPTTISEALLNSNLRITGAVQYWLNGAEANVNTTVAPGATVTIVGSVKGG